MILVTGATGLNGGELVRRLSKRGAKVRALVRNRAKAEGLAALPGVELAEGDLGKPESLGEALRGVTRAMLISSSVPTMKDVQCCFTDACVKAKVPHLVKLSGIIPELDSPFRFARMHAEIEQYIEKSGLAFTHLRAGEFMHSYFRQAGVIAAKGILPLPMGDARIASIDVGDIAEVSVQVLTGPGHENKIYPLTGPEALTMSEVAQRLSQVTGRTIGYVDLKPEEARAARLAAGMPAYNADALDELFSERRKGKESKVWDTLQAVFKLQPTTFLDFAKRWAAVFRGEQPPPKLQ
jgi:uncharacterized protein YbjT (DUF2867 family)